MTIIKEIRMLTFIDLLSIIIVYSEHTCTIPMVVFEAEYL